MSGEVQASMLIVSLQPAIKRLTRDIKEPPRHLTSVPLDGGCRERDQLHSAGAIKLQVLTRMRSISPRGLTSCPPVGATHQVGFIALEYLAKADRCLGCKRRLQNAVNHHIRVGPD